MTAFRKFDPYAALAEAELQNFSNFSNFSRGDADLPAAEQQPIEPSPVAANDSDFAERAAIIEEGAGVPREWAEGFARLCTMVRPASVLERRWQAVIDNSGRFIDRWATQAAALGWDTNAVFGCHPTRPDARLELNGLVWRIGEVIAITAMTATLRTRTGHELVYRRTSPRPGEPVIPAWEIDP